MIVEKADRPSVNMHEMYRLQLTLADLPSIFTIDLLPPLSIAKWIGYALPLRYVSCLSLKPAVSLAYVALARTGLMTGAALPPMLRHQTYYLNLLLKRGMI
jgi:hypothetical protein